MHIYHACASRGYVVGVGVHMYIYICDAKKKIEGILAVDLPFQTLAVDFSSNL